MQHNYVYNVGIIICPAVRWIVLTVDWHGSCLPQSVNHQTRRPTVQFND